jgi:four helix bundle protein
LRFKETAMGQRPYDLEDRLVYFAVGVLKFVDTLPSNFVGKYYKSQMIRSGGSSALNYGEAQGAESRRDFVHKMQIVLKELRETQIALRILGLRGIGDEGEVKSLQNEVSQLVAICTSIVSKVKQNNRTLK